MKTKNPTNLKDRARARAKRDGIKYMTSLRIERGDHENALARQIAEQPVAKVTANAVAAEANVIREVVNPDPAAMETRDVIDRVEQLHKFGATARLERRNALFENPIARTLSRLDAIYNNPAVRHVERMRAIYDNPVLRHAVRLTALIDNPLLRHAERLSAVFQNPSLRIAQQVDALLTVGRLGKP